MKRTTILFSLLTYIMLMVGCSKFLDKEPLSAGTEPIYFKNAAQFVLAANALYNLEGWTDYNNAATYYKMDQGLDVSGFTSNGGGTIPETDFHWDKTYNNIRNCNILLAEAQNYEGDKTGINASIGTAYFFRAWQHFYLLQRFGGVPIVDHPLALPLSSTDNAIIYGPRNSRYEVAEFILNDLRAAIPLLPKEKSTAATDKGKVSTEAAKSFLARVLLYEATWEKYVPSIGYDLDGDGTIGAGTNKPTDYPSITAMFTESQQMAKEVIQEAETGTFQLWSQCDSLSYYYLFNIDDAGGNISNYKNAGKTTNKEFIFSAKYDYNVKKGGVNLAHTIPIWGGANISTVFGESFLCRNGLPIRVSSTGNMADAQNNPQFLGFSRFYDEFRNRDYRFIGTAFLPDRVSWMTDPAYGIACTVVGQPYPTPVYPKAVYDSKDPAFSSKAAIYVPTLLSTGNNFNAYGSRKYMPEGALRANLTESPDYPLIRLAEVHLIYAEATVELGNGSISDADLDFSINKNRTRAGVAKLSNALIADVWDAGWWDHVQNKTVCKKMNMLDEIRRERACELYGEGFRMDDLKRWGIAHINLKGQKLGRHVYGTQYMIAIANDATYHGQAVYQPNKFPLLYGVYDETKGVDPSDPDYGRSIATNPGNLLFSQYNYLSPIPALQIRLSNKALQQNPGW